MCRRHLFEQLAGRFIEGTDQWTADQDGTASTSRLAHLVLRDMVTTCLQ